MPEILSQQKIAPLNKTTSSPLQNKTTKVPEKDSYNNITKEDEEDENNENHSDGKHPDQNHSGDKFPPRWKHKSRMYEMDMKPAGNTIKLKCIADGKCIIKANIHVDKI